MKEEVLRFGKAQSLVGIVTDPPETADSPASTAVLVLNAGLLHRVGPNRLGVKLARKFAAMGFVALRFDFSGIGDSGPRMDGLSFQKSAVSETQEAMDALRASHGIERFILIGLCSGGTISFRTACADPRVIGAIPLNARLAWHALGLATRAYFRLRLYARYYLKLPIFNPESVFYVRRWVRSFRRAVDGRRPAAGAIRKRDLTPPQVADAEKGVDIQGDLYDLSRRGVRLLLVFSEFDTHFDYLQAVLSDELDEDRNTGEFMRLEIIQGSDHEFTPLAAQDRLFRLVQDWAETMAQPCLVGDRRSA